MLNTEAMNIIVKNTRNVNPQFVLCGKTHIADITKPKIAVNINDEGSGAGFHPCHVMKYHLFSRMIVLMFLKVVCKRFIILGIRNCF